MSKVMKILLITASGLVLLGGIVFVILMSAIGWDFKNLSTSNYEIKTYHITEDFSSISINSDTDDITFYPAEGDTASVVYVDEKNLMYDVSVKDGTLLIDLIDTRKWYHYINFGFNSKKIDVYLPKTEYSALKISEDTGDIDIPEDLKFDTVDIAMSTGDVSIAATVTDSIKISGSTGDVSIKDVSAGSLDIRVSTGDVSISETEVSGDVNIKLSTGKTYLTSLTCENLTSDASTGDIRLKNVIAKGKFSIERSTGDVDLDASDAAEIFILTDTGDVRGSLLSEKVFIIDTDTGRKDVPKTINGGRCEITTDTGDIIITIE